MSTQRIAELLKKKNLTDDEYNELNDKQIEEAIRQDEEMKAAAPLAKYKSFFSPPHELQMKDVVAARVAPAILKLRFSPEYQAKMAAGVERMLAAKAARKEAKLAAEMEANAKRIDAEEEAREERDRYHYYLDRKEEKAREERDKRAVAKIKLAAGIKQ